MREDSEIIELYVSRNEQAITETDIKYGAFCRSVSLRIVKDMRDAEECVSDTYFKAWESIPPELPRSLSAFLGRIVRNISLDRYRRRNAKKRSSENIPYEELSECIPDNSDTSETQLNNAIADSLNEFLSELPQEHRVYFMRRYYMGEALNEIAARYGISANRLAALMHRLRKKFKAKLIADGVFSERSGQQ